MVKRGELRLREVKLLAPPHTAPAPHPPNSPPAALGSTQDTGTGPERRCKHGRPDLLGGLEPPGASQLPEEMGGHLLGVESFMEES